MSAGACGAFVHGLEDEYMGETLDKHAQSCKHTHVNCCHGRKILWLLNQNEKTFAHISTELSSLLLSWKRHYVSLFSNDKSRGEEPRKRGEGPRKRGSGLGREGRDLGTTVYITSN